VIFIDIAVGYLDNARLETTIFG